MPVVADRVASALAILVARHSTATALASSTP